MELHDCQLHAFTSTLPPSGRSLYFHIHTSWGHCRNFKRKRNKGKEFWLTCTFFSFCRSWTWTLEPLGLFLIRHWFPPLMAHIRPCFWVPGEREREGKSAPLLSSNGAHWENVARQARARRRIFFQWLLATQSLFFVFLPSSVTCQWCIK